MGQNNTIGKQARQVNVRNVHGSPLGVRFADSSARSGLTVIEHEQYPLGRP